MQCVTMDQYLRTPEEFGTLFATERAWQECLFGLRWPTGSERPRCSACEGWLTGRGLTACAACGHHGSVMAGTVFQDRHRPLSLQLQAVWLSTSQKTGARALGVQRILGLGSCQTAWACLHRLRRAMVRPSRDRLPGRVAGHPGSSICADRRATMGHWSRWTTLTESSVVAREAPRPQSSCPGSTPYSRC